jgi:hypothetical protein
MSIKSGTLQRRHPHRDRRGGVQRARIEVGAQVEVHAVVFVNTVVPAGMAVPMGWFAGGDPAQLVAPGDWERIRGLMGPLDYAGTVFGVGETDTLMPDIARRYTRSLALHNRDRVLPPGLHDRLADDTSTQRPAPKWTTATVDERL